MNDTNISIVERLAIAGDQLSQAGMPYEISSDAEQPIRRYEKAPATLRELIDPARGHGEQDFLVYQDERLSFKDFFRDVDALAHQLVNEIGIVKGDRIAIAMRNYPEWPIAYAAIVCIGAVAVPLNSWGSEAELNYGLTDCGARLLICDEQRLVQLTNSSTGLSCQAIVVRAEAEWPAHTKFETLVAAARGQAMPDCPCDTHDTVQIMYTSGTGGRPKGAVSSHQNICQAIFNFEYHAVCSAMANPRAIELMFAKGYAPSTLLAVPLFHVSGCYAVFLLNLRGARKIVMMHKWDPVQALDIIARERISIFSASPSMVTELLQHPKFADSDTDSLFSIGGGGSACPEDFGPIIKDALGDAYVGTGYGMTESNAAGASCVGEAYNYKPNSAGQLSPIIDFKTCDDEGNDLERGEVGEIYLRSPCNIEQYWQLPDATARSFKNGWMATGDLGYIDDENFIFLVGRSKDMILRGGENIYPAEVENSLMSHPAVLEAAVFAVESAQYGESPRAVLRLKPNAHCAEQELHDYVKQRVAAYKMPDQFIISEQALPRNPAGKVLKQTLQQQYPTPASK